MTRQTFLKAIVLISLAAVILLPTYIILVLEPSFVSFIAKRTEVEAINIATYMADMFFKEHDLISKQKLPENLKEDVANLQEKFHIIKVKVFSPDGEIIFSTSHEDIGTLNKNTYFHEKVSKGQVYTKIVQKDNKTLEGQHFAVDVVETYVPIMKNRSFSGAFEIYYDITESKRALYKILLHSKETSIFFSLCLLIAVIITARQAYRSNRMQERAEDDLREAHNKLETRVIERTSKLNELNKTLNQEIIDRKETEAEKEILIKELQEAIGQVKTLRGLLPICSSCQQIRDTKGNWNRIDEYIQEHTEVELTHGICPKCAKTLYPELYSEIEKDL